MSVLDKFFGWLDGGPVASAPAPVAKALRPAPVPVGASEFQRRAAKLAAMSDKCRRAYLRLEKKATVLAATPGAITPFKDESGRQWFKVLSQGGAGSYNVTPRFCDCPAVDSRRIHGYCKHMLAVRMYIGGTKQAAAEIIKERKAPPMPDRKINDKIAKFLKSCCEVHFYHSGTLWRGVWLDGYEYAQGSGTFEKLGFTRRQLMDYAADHSPDIQLAIPRKTRGQITVSVPANKQEHRDRKVLREAQALEAHGQPERSALVAEQNREMEIRDHLREDFGQQVAEAVREVAEPPKGNGHREQAEPPEPEDDPGPLAAPAPAKGKIIVSACVTMRGTLVVVQGQGAEFRPMLEGKRAEDVYVALRKAGLVLASTVGREGEVAAFLVNPQFVTA